MASDSSLIQHRCVCDVKMDNKAYDVEKGLELSTVNTDSPGAPTEPFKHSCKPELCRSLFLKNQQKLKASATSSPWHRLKTVFLVTILAFLGIWMLIYVSSSRMGLV